VAGWLAAAAVAAAITLAPSSARAQQAENDNRVSARGKGIAGGILLGAEVVMIPIGIAGVKAWWPYVLFGAVGAGGGAVGGYFVEQVAEGGDKTGPAEPSLYMLAGGAALIIPTLVVILNATAYDPEEETQKGEESSDDGEGSGTPTVESPDDAETTGARSRLPMALFGFSTDYRHSELSMGIPAVQVGPLHTQTEMATYGVEPGTLVNVPIVHGSF
jgi:hypothetical protein